MSITFGGLATGMDTESIISALMKIERQPITRLENDKSYYKSRLDAFTQLDTKLKDLQTKAEAIDTSNELNTPTASVGTSGYFTATASSTANLSSYQVSVVDVAQVQKDVSQGYVSETAASFGTGTLTLTVGGTPTSITIDSTNNSLDGIANAINTAAAGVTASIINDGTGTPYRMVLSGDNVNNAFSLDATGLTGGTYANPTMTNKQTAQQAHIQVDGIDIYSDTNTFSSAISGVTIDLLKADPNLTGTNYTSTLAISSDPASTKQKINDFADAYNSIITFINDQKDAGWGNDSSLRSIKRHLQDMLTTAQVGGSGSYSTLAEIGLETQRDGTVLVNDTTLSDALSTDFNGVISLVAGETGVTGVSTSFIDYITGMTDSINGLLATRTDSTDSNIKRIDTQIDSLNARMDAREKSLRAQFSAMEDLVSSLNSQGSYLSQQMASMPSIG